MAVSIFFTQSLIASLCGMCLRDCKRNAESLLAMADVRPQSLDLVTTPAPHESRVPSALVRETPQQAT